jgi:class 3 adenylate cyclase/transcriptional regulator with XRE-family HTH domain
MTNPQPKRKRGVVLTLPGWQRLLAAKRHSEIQTNSGNAYTLEELSERTNLSPNTLTRIQRRQLTVDRQSLESYFKAFNLTLTTSDYTKLDSEQMENRLRVTLKGQVPLDSPFYIERPPVEWLCYQTILQPGALIRIKAPKQMGKTSLMARILSCAEAQDLHTVPLSLQLADAAVFTDLNRFLQWFCAVVTRRLGLPNRVTDYWDDIFSGNYNCTDYFENYLLPEIEIPLVLALDEVDVVFEYPSIATDFFGMLRAWYEIAKYGSGGSNVWEKLRLVVVHSTEVYIPLNINQSPFNVGFSVELPDFTAVQVQELATRHGLDWDIETVERLMTLTEGHPYLVQVALHHISHESITLDELLETASEEDGIYIDHLHRQLWNLRQYPDLVRALTGVVMSKKPLALEPKQAFRLQSMGLVRVENQEVIPSCGLYRRYFSDRLGKLRLNLLQENRLATIVFIGVVDFEAKMQADPEQTQNLLYQDFQTITQVSQQFEGQVLKSIGDGLLLYFPNVNNAVNCAQEIQLALEQMTGATSASALTYRIGIHFGDVIFSYSDIMGAGINIATRIQAEVPPRGICISEAVYDAVKNYLPLQPINLGQRRLEGVEEPIPLYQLIL